MIEPYHNLALLVSLITRGGMTARCVFVDVHCPGDVM